MSMTVAHNEVSLPVKFGSLEAWGPLIDEAEFH